MFHMNTIGKVASIQSHNTEAPDQYLRFSSNAEEMNSWRLTTVEVSYVNDRLG